MIGLRSASARLSVAVEASVRRHLTVTQRLVLLLGVCVAGLAALFFFRAYVVVMGPVLAFAGFALATLFSLIANGVIARSIVLPLRQTIGYCEAIGNLRYDSPIDLSWPDEIGDVVRALDRMQHRLGENEAALRTLSSAIEHSPASVMITDRAGTITYVNPKFSAVTGYSAAETIGQNPRMLNSGLQPPAFYADLWATIRAGREWHGEFANRKKHGETFWERASISSILDSQGEITHFVAVKEDITQKKQAEEAEAVQRALLERSHVELAALNAQLERAAREWRTTVDMIDAALIVLEPSGPILRMNLAAAATLPDGLAAWIGRPCARLAERQPWAEALALARDALDRQAVTTGRVRDTLGRRTWDLGCRVLLDQPRPTVLVLARDVTEVVDLQESVQHSETMAALGSLVVGVAHEVRNPLFAISSLVDAWAVQSHRDPTPFVEALRSQVNRLRTLMVELLEYGRPATFTWHVAGVRGVIDCAVRACAHEAAALNVRISVTATNDVDVLMDPRRLERVFINLIQNAVQHAPGDSAVLVEMAVSAPSDSSKVEITVRDRGPGFAPDDLPRVFKPFFSRRPGGFGLGLAITERIITEHRGRVTAANDPCGGAVITVCLPLTHPSPAATVQEVTVSC